MQYGMQGTGTYRYLVSSLFHPVYFSFTIACLLMSHHWYVLQSCTPSRGSVHMLYQIQQAAENTLLSISTFILYPSVTAGSQSVQYLRKHDVYL